MKFDVAVVGGGFAGSLLARLLAVAGRQVLLLERDRHPRFALGESSTPLANLALERIALQHGLEDLYSHAAHGRWLRDLPAVPCGLKRGFTFYGHQCGDGRVGQRGAVSRLAVAASPDDFVADCQWDRAALDHGFLQQAQAAGVRVREGHELRSIESRANGTLSLTAVDPGSDGARGFEAAADFVVDASGAAGAVARRLGARALGEPAGFCTELVFGHVSGLRPFEETERFECPIYPESRSAVHHMTPDGWMYQLRFDDDRTSVGIVSRRDSGPKAGAPESASPADRFWSFVERYPALAAQFGRPDSIEIVHPLGFAGPLQRRLDRATGPGFAVLPHTYAFYGPLFAVGIAWSLLGVERLFDCLTCDRGERVVALTEYQRQLALEADHVERLMRRAWLEFPTSFERFSQVAQAYFVAASFEESRQRLLDPPAGGWAWQGFLGATDECLADAFLHLGREDSDLSSLVGVLEPRNVAGFFSRAPAARAPAFYPVDLDILERSAQKLGLDRFEYQRRCHRLRSPDWFAEAQAISR
jgi:FADH2 O2-dependent halogenase